MTKRRGWDEPNLIQLNLKTTAYSETVCRYFPTLDYLSSDTQMQHVEFDHHIRPE